MGPRPPPPKGRAAPLDGRVDRWLLVESVSNLPVLHSPGAPLSATCPTCCPFLFPNVYQTISQIVYARCLYKKNCITPVSVSIVLGGEVAVGLFFLPFLFCSIMI